MTRGRALNAPWLMMKCGIVALALSGCTSTPIIDGAYFRAPSNAALHMVEAAENLEASNTDEAFVQYQQALTLEKLDRAFPDYQKQLAAELQAYQDSMGKSEISKQARLGIPEVYARQVLANVKAHQGLARIYLARHDWAMADAEASEAITIMKSCPFCPYSHAKSQRESNRILEQVYQAQKATGKALIRKLIADLLEDHLRSEGGIEDFYIEKKVLLGETNQKSVAEVERLYQSVMQYQSKQQAATVNAIAGGLLAVNAGVQQGLAQSALSDSGGVMTSQVQMAQLNAQLATMGSTLFTALAVSQAAGGNKALEANETPWAIPTFAQQLVDPKQGMNTPDIMRGFAATVSQTGGSSYRAGSQQITQAVDTLQQLRNNSTPHGLDTEVKKFAETFNAFLIQVQEIK